MDLGNNEFTLKKNTASSGLLSLEQNQFNSKDILMFMKKEHKGDVFKVKTKLGYTVECTSDHPLLTDKGMVDAGKLRKGDDLVVYPFEGVEFTEHYEYDLLSDDILLSDVQKKELEKRGLYPLSSKNKNLPIIAKLFGFLLGDGNIHVTNEGKGRVCAYGNKEDLELIQKDFEELGFSARIYTRERDHKIPTRYGDVEFTAKNSELQVSSISLANLFFSLGYPKGTKTKTAFLVPEWVIRSPLWLKRLFLAGFFGAEMNKSSTSSKTCFQCPTISFNKNDFLLDNARKFLIQIMQMLEEFGIESHKLQVKEDFHNQHGNTMRLKLMISTEEENLLKLYSKVGFEYNPERQFFCHAAVLYLKEKQLLKQKRSEIAFKAKEYRAKGLKLAEVKDLLVCEYANERFVTRYFYNDKDPRVTLDFISFDDFVAEKRLVYDEKGYFVDAIESIEIKSYEGFVYDFNVPETHNFIAGSVVVSNCGMRLIVTNLTESEVAPKIKELVHKLYEKVPVGVGKKGTARVNREEFDQVMINGAQWCVENGYGWKEDVDLIESRGKIPGADPSKVSEKARKRGFNQLGTLGSGNHYLEVQVADKEAICDEKAAKAFGITKDKQVVVMVHCGSRGFGHQIGTDYLRKFVEETMPKYGIQILDKELACAPFNSPEGQDYFKAMSCGANMAFANRQVITHRIREAFSEVFGKSAKEMEMKVVYDVAHNIAKLEKHTVDGVEKELVVHRKGSTRAFGPGRKEDLPEAYKEVGQPVILGGSMETGSYLLVGQDGAEDTFGSTAHGAGRIMSRMKAKKLWRGDELQKKMEKEGIYVKGASLKGLAEEAGGAYKDVHAVVKTLESAGITKRVVALRPIGNIKG